MLLINVFVKLIAYVVHVLDERFKLCFNMVKLDEMSVKLLTQRAKKGDKEAIKELEKIYALLTVAECVKEAMMIKIRDAVEEAFVTSIAETSVIKYIGKMGHPEWVMSFRQYVPTMIKTIENIVNAMKADGTIDNISEDYATALQTCHLKMKIVFSNQSDSFADFPFLCPSFLVALHEHFSKISSAILEVHI